MEMLPEQNDLAAAARTWNREDETLEHVNKRIHDGVPLDQLEQRADWYVSNIVNLFPYVRLKPDASVMEIGSGTGYIMEAMDRLAQSQGIKFQRVVGLDIAEHMIAKAKRRLGDRARFSFVHYDGIRVPLPDKSFDMIYSVAALQHVPKPYVYNLFFEIHRLLSDDGHAVIQLFSFKYLPRHEQLIPWRDEIRNQLERVEAHWHHFYSVEELEFVLRASGFKHVDVRDGEGIWFLVRPKELNSGRGPKLLSDEIADLQSQIEAMREKLEVAQAEKHGLQANLAAADERVVALLNSRSWRVTAPLRRAAETLRRRWPKNRYTPPKKRAIS